MTCDSPYGVLGARMLVLLPALHRGRPRAARVACSVGVEARRHGPMAPATTTAPADDAEAAVGRISVSASPHRKCERCWHWRADTGACPVHPALCARFMSNLYAEGEPRCCA